MIGETLIIIVITILRDAAPSKKRKLISQGN